MRERFARAFGGRPTAIWSAPGRINLIGEHIDYVGGDVLPIAIGSRVCVAVGPVAGGRSHVTAGRRRQPGAFDPAAPARGGAWWDYVAGVSRALTDRGATVPPLAIAVAGDIPTGAGLSSSAALCVAAAGALGEVSGAGLTPEDLASIAHEAEVEHVGVPCGIMDQHASALCREGFALHLHCRDRSVRHVPFADSVLIFDTAEPRALRRSRYEERRRELAVAMAALRELEPGLEWLVDATPQLLERSALPATPRARARHAITEQLRVREAAAALAAGGGLPGSLVLASHASLRDDYECSTRALDWFVSMASERDEITGARLTGAGWGGCAIAFGEHAALESVAPLLAASFAREFGRAPRWWLSRAADGARREAGDG